MKFFIALFLLATAQLSFKIHADIPLNQALEVLRITDKESGLSEYLSPLWGMAMLYSNALERMRFFGNYGEKADIGLPIFKYIAGQVKQNPQDPIAALIQYLFPSVDGEILTA